ncbi:MAG: GIY-YIG nuclease family protein [Methanobacteriota archaeon]|nr:MAG: GIY-YIG nuclease family protein [Euryarchaeota archaeon]
MVYVYILKSETTGRLYIGQTDNIRRRLGEHNRGKNVSTRHGGPWSLLGALPCKTRSEAVQLEQKLKSFKRRDRVLAYLKRHS